MSRPETPSLFAGRRHSVRFFAPTTSNRPIVAVCSGPPLESADRYAAHLLATILGDHTGSRLYWTLIDPGLADGAELSYQDYNQAGSFFTFLSCEPEQTAGQPRSDRRSLQNGHSRRADRGRAEPGQEQGTRSRGASQRTADGASGVAGVPLDVPPYLHPGRRRARSVQSRHRQRPAPALAGLAALAALDRLGWPDDRDPTARVTASRDGAFRPERLASGPSLIMRIVSLLPSLTELVCNLGRGGDLVGVTHECDYPDEVRKLPHLTRSRIPGLPRAQRSTPWSPAGRQPVRAGRSTARRAEPGPDPHPGTMRRLCRERGRRAPRGGMLEKSCGGGERQPDDPGWSLFDVPPGRRSDRSGPIG